MAALDAKDAGARGAIFDLDGTLADTADDLLGAVNVSLAEHGLPTLDPVADRRVAGRGGRAMIRRSLEIAGRDPDLPDWVDLTDRIYPEFLLVYEDRIDAETRLFEGVEACLERLARGGWRLGVCTNKPEKLARILLGRLGVGETFAAILGADTLPVRKPDPEHFRETARRIGAAPHRSVMLGDTETDLLTARAAGVPVALTRFGFAADPLESLAPDAQFGHYRELPDLLERLMPL